MSLFTNQLVLVFGGARDIGRACSVELARQGAFVCFTYNSGGSEETLEAIHNVGGEGLAFRVNALDTTAVRNFATEATKRSGRKISSLVNVVGGLIARKPMEEMDDSFWNHVFAVNVTSTFAMTQAALPLMLDGGSIVNFSSQAGRDGGGAGAVAYASTKGAIMTFTRALAKELSARRIRVNCVCPGMIATKFHDDFTKPEVRARVAASVPLGREGRAEEVANLVTFLASNQSPYVNGTCVDINGGTLFS